MSSQSNNTLSTCNYTSLGNYDGFEHNPNTLSNIVNPFVKYPVQPNYQVVPIFAGTGDYKKPNYNSLCKGSCYNYAGINQAYIDCSNPDSSKACSLNGGKCVTYVARGCPQDGVQVRPTTGPTMGPTTRPTMGPTTRPTMGPTMRPTMMPTMGPTMMPTMGPTMMPTMMPTMGPTMMPTMGPTMMPTMRS